MNPKDLAETVRNMKPRQAAAHLCPPGYVLFDETGKVSRVGVGASIVVAQVPQTFIGKQAAVTGGYLLSASDE